MKPPGGDSHDIFGQDFNGSPSHHRVLKPPGGGSSDIFGADHPDGFVPRRNVRSHEGSLGKVLSEPDSHSPTSPNGKPRVDSHSRLFGPAPQGHATPSKNRMKSNIPIGETPVTNGVHDNGHSTDTTDGNPVTGNGYPGSGINQVNGVKGNVMDSHSNGINGHGNGMNGHGNGMNGRGNGINDHGNGMNGHGNGMNGHDNGHGLSNGHRRVPPGGFSSGLW